MDGFFRVCSVPIAFSHNLLWRDELTDKNDPIIITAKFKGYRLKKVR